MSLDPRQPFVTGPSDPEHDPAASYALEPSTVKALTDRIVSTTGHSEPTYSPITGQPLVQVPQSSEADVEEAFTRARRAQRAWARTSLEDRAARLLRLHDLVLDRQDEIIDLICWETGKARKHAFDEPLHVALTARYYARTAREHLDTTRRIGVIPALTRVEVNHVPRGVVGIISPWNYPFNLALIDGIAALLAGNAVVTKPDAQTMLSALVGAELLEEAGIPRDLWQVVAGPGSEIGPAVVARADYVCFTGSTATGRLIAQGLRRAAHRLLAGARRQEPGARAPRRRPRARRGGRRPRLLLQRRPALRLDGADVRRRPGLRPLRRPVRRAHAGDEPRHQPGLGQRHGLAHLAAAARHRDRATSPTPWPRAPPCSPGGAHRPDLGPFFYEPTILEGVTPDMTCFGKETFGPVVSRLPLPRRGRRDQPRQRGAVRPQRQHLSHATRSVPARSPGRSCAAASTSTRGSAPASPASTRRWAGSGSPASAGARAARASSGSPSRSRSRCRR